MIDVIRKLGVTPWLLGPLAWATINSIALSTEPDSRHIAVKEITDSIGMKLVLIPHGTFQMGSPATEEGRFGHEGPEHEIEISKDFYMGRYAVTRGQFRRFIEATNYKTDADKHKGGVGYFPTSDDRGSFFPDDSFSWRNTGFDYTDEHPVVNVSWNDAKAFCDWLARKEGKPYRLPTEAEWEYACRAGTTTRFYSGDKDSNLRAVANVADRSLKAKWDFSQMKPKEFQKELSGGSWFANWDDGFPFTAPVGQFQSNSWGLYDMLGNVRQWCSDRYDPNFYGRSPRKDPEGPKEGKARIVRGGSWFYGPRSCRCAARLESDPVGRMCDIGFRVVVPVASRTP
jgi:formylglycine-generating enzyme required for sulfatase activity